MKLDEIQKTLLSLINLVTFDSCDESTSYWRDDASPLTKVLVCELSDPIPKELHAQLRKSIKTTLFKRFNVYAGKIVLSPNIEIKVYFRTLRPPAYDPDL